MLGKNKKSRTPSGNSYIFFSSSALTIMLFCLFLVVGVIVIKAGAIFYPKPVSRYTLADGKTIVGIEKDRVRDKQGAEFIFIETGNKEIYGQAYQRLNSSDIVSNEPIEDVIIAERYAGSLIIGFLDKNIPRETLDGRLAEVAKKRAAVQEIQEELNEINRQIYKQDQAYKKQQYYAASEIDKPDNAALKAEFEVIQKRLSDAEGRLGQDKVIFKEAGGQAIEVPLASVLRYYYPNQLGFFEKLIIYFSKTWLFLTEYPRESNTEGGIFPTIIGTFSLVIIMSVFAFPLGVLVAIYLTEYAGTGVVVKIIRICINNLAGIPSIVFGVFGLGFFVYGVGSYIDTVFFPERLPEPTFGTGGILWASLTLSLLTVPVVIVAAEEALAAVPAGMKHSSLALGSTKLQTLMKISLPHAFPGILTGFILAVSRGAGEVAPLMITGVVKFAPSLPIDGNFPFIHPENKFMHLGFHIYDVGFQSPDIEQAKPMVFMTALVLLVIVLLLNIIAIRLRERMRRLIHVKTI